MVMKILRNLGIALALVLPAIAIAGPKSTSFFTSCCPACPHCPHCPLCPHRS